VRAANVPQFFRLYAYPYSNEEDGDSNGRQHPNDYENRLHEELGVAMWVFGGLKNISEI
jgi:hypothetical protein